MKKDIVWKLNEELKPEAVTSEREVVYFLVELRKLLELNKTLNEYWTLNVCCDWAVHPKMNRATAQIIVSRFDDYEVKYRKESVGISQAGMPELTDFVGHLKFREELIAACDRYGVSVERIRDDDWWRSFLVQYTEVDKDCPFEAKADNTTFVTKVTAHAVSAGSLGLFIPDKPFGIMWMWERRCMDSLGNVTSLF